LLAISSQLSALSSQLSALSSQLSALSSQLSAVSSQLSAPYAQRPTPTPTPAPCTLHSALCTLRREPIRAAPRRAASKGPTIARKRVDSVHHRRYRSEPDPFQP